MMFGLLMFPTRWPSWSLRIDCADCMAAYNGMSIGFCQYCGLRMDGTAADGRVHAYCMPAYHAEQEVAAKRPKTAMEQQLDRIEGLLMAIRDRYSL